MRAHLNLEQAHEYLRQRLARTRQNHDWSLDEVFTVLDSDVKGSISIFDIEKLIIEHKKSGSRTLVDDVDLLIQMYDRTSYQRIVYVDFSSQLLPKLA